MIRKPNLQDPSPLTGVYEGDLKYGRCLESVPVKQKDYNAERSQETGEAQNKPIFALPPAFKRDETFWKGRCKHPKIVSNPPDLAEEILVSAVKFRSKYSLLANVSRITSNNKTLLAGH
jgi:hypothetical protein